MANTRPPIGQKQDGARGFLLLFPLLLLGGSAILFLSAPFSWNAGEVLDLPAWAPPLLGIGMALAGGAIGLYALKEVARRTYGTFEVFTLQLFFGMFMFVVGAALQVVFAMQIGSTSTYERGLSPDGEIEVHPVMFMFGTTFLVGMALAWVWAAAFVYVNAITNLRPNRFSERPANEVDGIGEILKDRE